MSKLDTIITDAFLRKADLMTSPDFRSEKKQIIAARNYKAVTKEEVKNLMLDLLTQSKQKGAPITWLESEINKL